MIDDESGERQEPQREAREGAAASGHGSLLPWLTVGALILFIAGLLLSPWFEENVRTRLPGPLQRADVDSVAADVQRQSRELAALTGRVEALEARPVVAPRAPVPSGERPALNDPAAIAAATGRGAAAEDIARLEARVDALDRRQAQFGQRVDNLSAEVAGLNVKLDNVGSDAAASIEKAARSAESARGVLLVSATRRALEQGESLVMLVPALRARFGKEHQDAVEALVKNGREVPTLLALRESFAGISPAMRSAARDRLQLSWWEKFKASLSDIVEVRRSGEPSARDAEAARLNEISARLARGDVDGALATYRRLPPEAQRVARDWRLDAESYAAAFGALRELEAAVLAPDAGAPGAAPRAPSDTL
jgi:hypothetical protein